MRNSLTESVFADRRLTATLIRSHVPGWADQVDFFTTRAEPTRHNVAVDPANRIPLLSECSWEGCLGGPSSLWARPAAFLFWGLQDAGRRPARQRISMDRHGDAPPLP